MTNYLHGLIINNDVRYTSHCAGATGNDWLTFSHIGMVHVSNHCTFGWAGVSGSNDSSLRYKHNICCSVLEVGFQLEKYPWRGMLIYSCHRDTIDDAR